MVHTDEYYHSIYYGGPDKITPGPARQEAPLLGYTVLSGRPVPLSRVVDMVQVPGELPGYVYVNGALVPISDVMEAV